MEKPPINTTKRKARSRNFQIGFIAIPGLLDRRGPALACQFNCQSANMLLPCMVNNVKFPVA
jgi:hypothetical protein